MTEGIPSTSALPCHNCNRHQTFGGARSSVDAAAAAALGAVAAPDDADSDADCSSGVDWSGMSSRN